MKKRISKEEPKLPIEKVCNKCNNRELTLKNICSHCGARLVFWKPRNRTLFNEFNKKWIDRGFNNLGNDIIIIQEKYFKEKHPGYKIDNVLSRLKLIDLLHTDYICGPFIDSGFGVDSALRLYLAATCFDILGANKDFISFHNWLHSNDYNEERGRILQKLDKQELGTNIAITFYDAWAQKHGVNKSFQRFFDKMLDDSDKDTFINLLWICKNPDWETYTRYTNGSFYARIKPNDWQELSRENKLKKLIGIIEQLARHNFTHEGIMVHDWSDKDYIQPEYRKAEKIFQNKDNVNICNSRKGFEEASEIRIGFNGISIGINKDEAYLFSEEWFNYDKFIKSFLEDCQKPILKGGDIYFESMKKVLCYRDCSITQLLVELAEKGLYNYIHLTAKDIEQANEEKNEFKTI